MLIIGLGFAHFVFVMECILFRNLIVILLSRKPVCGLWLLRVRDSKFPPDEFVRNVYVDQSREVKYLLQDYLRHQHMALSSLTQVDLDQI